MIKQEQSMVQLPNDNKNSQCKTENSVEGIKLSKKDWGRNIISKILDNDIHSFYALLDRNSENVDYVLDDHAEWKQYNGQSMLQISICCGCNPEIAHALIERGANVNFISTTQEGKGATVLQR